MLDQRTITTVTRTRPDIGGGSLEIRAFTTVVVVEVVPATVLDQVKDPPALMKAADRRARQAVWEHFYGDLRLDIVRLRAHAAKHFPSDPYREAAYQDAVLDPLAGLMTKLTPPQ